MNPQVELWKQEFELHGAPTLLCTKAGVVHTLNNSGRRLFGDTNGVSLHTLFDDASGLITRFEYLIAGRIEHENVRFQEQLYKADIRLLGEDVWIRLSTQNMSDEVRLRKLGALSGGLFHAIRNPLTIVQGRVELMQMMTTDERSLATLDIVYEQCSRIAQMLDNTQQITLQPVQHTQFSLNRLLQQSFSEYFDGLECNLPAFTALNDEGRLKIALDILAGHISSSGLLANIELRRHLGAMICTLQCELDSDGIRFFQDVQSTIRMNKPVQFTSSTREQHIQMLSVIFSDCSIDFECTPDGCITLSMIHHESDANKLKILVVDDDDILRETVVALLSLQGHHILTANTAEEAKLLWEDSVDVVLLDVNLPKMSGPELLSEVQTEHPTWVNKTILISGIASFGQIVGVRFLPKPFSKKQLNAAIDSIIAN